ncbi:MAG: hypothetical protein IIW39_04970, partial [Clostridia bacterium]|nr:hypothetical protein [Clostridia bacterium]
WEQDAAGSSSVIPTISAVLTAYESRKVVTFCGSAFKEVFAWDTFSLFAPHQLLRVPYSAPSFLFCCFGGVLDLTYINVKNRRG